MKRIVLFVLSVLFVLCVVSPVSPVAYAQDATPEATPVVVSGGDTITIEQPAPVEASPLFDLSKALPYIAVIVLLLVLVVIEVVDKRRLSELVAKSMTPEMFAIVSAAINKGVADAGSYVALTPSPLDDALFRPTKAQVDDLLARIQALEDAKSGAQVTVNNNAAPTPDSGSNSG